MGAPFLLPSLGGPILAFEAPDYINPLALEAPELIAFIEAKQPRAIGSWRELGGEEYARSFTAARTMGYDVVRDLQDGFLEVMREPGATGDDFVARLIPILRRKGWMAEEGQGALARRLQLIYDTNLRTSQAVGYWDRIQRVKAAMPYLLAGTARDSRVRHPPHSHEDHRAFDGILLPVDHPFWLAYFPPLGFRCRCSVVQKTRSQVARMGRGVTSEDELAERIARLGKPFGFNPGLRPLAPVELAAERANAVRLEGAPPIEPAREAQLGGAVWAELAGRALAEAA